MVQMVQRTQWLSDSVQKEICINVCSSNILSRETSRAQHWCLPDDGKLFHGSGVGVPFGPRCFEGDIMGCGIMFPRDFCQDSAGERRVACVTHPVVPRTARPRSPFFSRVSVRRGGRLGLRRQSQTQRGAERHVRPGWRGGRGGGGWGWGRGFGRQESRGKVASINSNSNFIYIVLFMQKKQNKTMQPKEMLTLMLTLLLGWTGVFHPEREGGGPPGAETTCRGLVPHHWNDEQRGEGEGGPAPAEWLSRGGTRKWVVQNQSRDGTRQWILAPLPLPHHLHPRPRPQYLRSVQASPLYLKTELQWMGSLCTVGNDELCMSQCRAKKNKNKTKQNKRAL